MRTRYGFTSVLMLFGLMLVGVICLTAADMASEGMKFSVNNRDEQVCEEAAQAGLEQATARAYASLDGNNGVFIAATYTDMGSVLDSIAPDCEALATVAPDSNSAYAYVTSYVYYKNILKVVRSHIKEKNVGIWNNAIFAGVGASGQSINGNVQIRGSVHILGDGEPYTDVPGLGYYYSGDPFTDTNKNGVWDPGEPYTDSLALGYYVGPDPYNDLNGNGIYDPPLTTTSLNDTLSGSAYVGNNYYGLPSSLTSLIPSAPQVNGIETLGAEVRAKHGQISINGTATIGSSSTINGGLDKATVDGMYVNDGYTGNQGTANVFSDNGTSNGYDLGNLGISFPVISGIGAQSYTDPSGSSWSNLTTYYQNRALQVNVSSILSTTAAFSYGPDIYGNSISFIPASGSIPAKLTVNGIVAFAGNVQIGTKDTITYAGTGTMYSPGNINIDGNFIPASGLTFPTSTTMGVVAKGNINLATGNGSAQLTLAGAFYAQDTIKSAKQNNVAGTFVASYFDMGTNVPAIAQVPSLPQHMPPGMPGTQNYYRLTIQSWRQVQ